MIRTQCISVTDLRTKTKACLAGLKKTPKYVFVNNRPIAVLIDIENYEESFLVPELKELEKSDVSKPLAKQAAKARTANSADLVNLV